MKVKQALFLALVGLIGIAIGLAGFWFAFRQKYAFQGSTTTLTGLKLPSEVGASHAAIPNGKDFFDALFTNATPTTVPSATPISAVLPHHLVAGSYEIGMLQAMAQKITPPVVAIVSPNHFNTGRAPIITAKENWQTPYGILEINKKLVNDMAHYDNADVYTQIDDSAIDKEHSVGALVSLIKKVWPNTKLVPIIIKNEANPADIDEVAKLLNKILPENSLLLASVDFSHYLPPAIADWHDQLSINVLQTGGYNRLEQLEVDSQNSLRLLLKYNELKNAQNFNLAFHTNSADIIKNPELTETISHVMGYFTLNQTPTGSGAVQGFAVPRITVQFFGDMMLDRNVAKIMGDKGLDYVFEHLAGQENRFFYGADLFIANLEGPFAPTRVKTSKSIAFKFDPALAPQLKRYNFSAFSLANNHALDMSRANYDFTKKILEQNDLGYFGHEIKVSEDDIWVAGAENNLPQPVAFVGINFTEGPVSDSQIKKVVAAAKKRAANVIVVPHWGAEYDRISNERERRWARLMIDAGASAVVGAHPHVIQEMEIYNGTPIFYSLGNFVFDQYFSTDTQEGLSVGLTLGGGRVKNIYVFPMYSVKSQNYLMAGERQDKFFEWFNKNSRMGDKKFENNKLEL